MRAKHTHGPLHWFEVKYGISTREFLRDFKLRDSIHHDDVFRWEVEVWRAKLQRVVYATQKPVVNVADGRARVWVPRANWRRIVTEME